MKYYRSIRLLILILFPSLLAAQTKINGSIRDRNHNPLSGAIIAIPKLDLQTVSDSLGVFIFKNIPKGTFELQSSHIGYESTFKEIVIKDSLTNTNIVLIRKRGTDLGEVVISGTMKEVSKLDSPVPVEVYSSSFFKSSPNPSLLDALQIINGVRPQLNCNICNTGDIHINGLEGPYTMVLIDGMPIVSGLSTVYGLSGIPQSLIERVEIVKGPASTLYGSEAVGGLINVITKSPNHAPKLSADIFGTSWGEISTNLGAKFNVGKHVQSLTGIDYFNFQNRVDKNHDNFTDITLQSRISIFNKWNFDRRENRIFTVAGRYVYEDRWGGDKDWTKTFRGNDLFYAESIYTKRWETFGTYQLPLKERILFQFSANGHKQNAMYGITPYIAEQYIGFGQFTWFKSLGRHDLLTGVVSLHVL